MSVQDDPQVLCRTDHPDTGRTHLHLHELQLRVRRRRNDIVEDKEKKGREEGRVNVRRGILCLR